MLNVDTTLQIFQEIREITSKCWWKIRVGSFVPKTKQFPPFFDFLRPRPQCVCDILFTLAWDIASTISPNSKSLICNINNWNLSVHQSYDLGHQYHHIHDCLTHATCCFERFLSEFLHFLKHVVLATAKEAITRSQDLLSSSKILWSYLLLLW